MNDSLVIKMNINGDFIENKTYNLEIKSSTSCIIDTLNNKSIDNLMYLNQIDNKVVPVVFKCLSRVDNMKIFILSKKQINRELKINSIL